MKLGLGSEDHRVFDTENEIIFKELIRNSLEYPTILFLGSGVSARAKYPTWKQLLEYFEDKIQQKDGHETFKLENLDGSLKDKAKEVRLILGDEFKSLLFDRFTDTQRYDVKDFSSEHSYLVNVPGINLYITTNYDVCLERSAFIPEETWYPAKPLEIELLYNSEELIIFHIHGIIDPNDKESLDTVIFDADDYVDIYDPRHILRSFLQQIFRNFQVIFLGFSMADEDIREVIQSVSEANEYLKLYSRDHKMIINQPRNHYIFLSDVEIKKEGENSDVEIDKDEEDSDDEIDKDGEDIEDFLSSNGITRIVYRVTKENYSEVQYITKRLKTNMEEYVQKEDFVSDPLSAILERKNE